MIRRNSEKYEKKRETERRRKGSRKERRWGVTGVYKMFPLKMP